MRAAFRQRGFGLLYAGLLASMLGDSLMLIVLAIWVKELTGSAGAAGLTFFFLAVPALVAPGFGMMIDRLKRRTVLIWGNLLSAVAVTPLLLVRDRGDVWVIYLVAVLYGISFVCLPAALNGLLKEMLAEDLLVDANASLTTSKEALRLVGPLAGAGLFTVIGGGGVAVLDLVTFLVAATTVVCLRLSEAPPERTDSHWRIEFLGGISHLRHDQVLRQTMFGVGLAVLVVGFLESAGFALVQAFGQPPSFIGVVVSVQGVGAIAGGVLSARIVRRLGEAWSISAMLGMLAGGIAVWAVAPSLAWVFAGTVVFGFALPVFLVAFSTLLQRRTPQRLMGRVSTAADVVLGTPQAISIAAGALLVTLISYRLICGISALVIGAAAGYLAWAIRGIARQGEVEAAPNSVVERSDYAAEEG